MSEAGEIQKPKWDRLTDDRLESAIANVDDMIALLEKQTALYRLTRSAMQYQLEKRRPGRKTK